MKMKDDIQAKRAQLTNRQRGSALIVSLVFLLAMTLIGVTAMQGTAQQESMAGNAREKNLAFQAAEAGLRRGERWLEGIANTIPPFPANASQCLFSPPSDSLATPTTDWGTFWMNYNWTPCRGYDLSLGQVSTQPQYAVEFLGTVAGSSSETIGNPLSEAYMFRITSRATGGNANAVSILQVIYQL